MRSKISQIRKQKLLLLDNTISLPQNPILPKAQLHRRSSLPTPNSQRSLNIKTLQNEDSNIYFSQYKKKKFMKHLIDGYFQETRHNISEIQKEQPGTERRFSSVGKNNRWIYQIDSGQNIISSKELQRSSRQIPKQPIQSEKEVEKESQNTHMQLPPISQQAHQNSRGALISNFSTLPPVFPSKNIKSPSNFSKSLIFENQVHRIYVSFEDGCPSYRIKQYKTTGVQVMKRQERAWKIGIERIWKPTKTNAFTFQSQLAQPLKSLICKICPSQIPSPKITLALHSTSYRSYLLSSNCANLFNLLHNLSSILSPITNKLQNNKVSPSNIYIIKNKPYLDQWGYSSFKSEYQIQNNLFQSRINPVLKSYTQWLVTPQYLAPQLLTAVLKEEQGEEKNKGKNQTDIWQEWGKSDVWSLGVTMLQIVTMVPIFIKEVCYLRSKTKNVTRCGFLATSDRQVNQIIRKQLKLSKNVQSYLQNEVGDEVPKQLISLIGRMLVFNPRERITLQEIINVTKLFIKIEL